MFIFMTVIYNRIRLSMLLVCCSRSETFKSQVSTPSIRNLISNVALSSRSYNTIYRIYVKSSNVVLAFLLRIRNLQGSFYLLMIRTVSFSRIAQQDTAGLRFTRDICDFQANLLRAKTKMYFAYRACG